MEAYFFDCSRLAGRVPTGESSFLIFHLIEKHTTWPAGTSPSLHSLESIPTSWPKWTEVTKSLSQFLDYDEFIRVLQALMLLANVDATGMANNNPDGLDQVAKLLRIDQPLLLDFFRMKTIGRDKVPREAGDIKTFVSSVIQWIYREIFEVSLCMLRTWSNGPDHLSYR